MSQLVGVAGLKDELDNKTQSDATFAVNWAIVKDWTEEARYERHGEVKVRDFLRAIVDRKKGVLSWLRDHW